MNIGQAAAESGVSAKMIRYYESNGLVEPAGRSAAGYRVYSDRDVHTLRFIRRARDLGFSVEQIQSLLELWRDRSRSSADVKEVAEQHISRLCEKVTELQAMIHTLKHLVERCSADDRPDCPILKDLSHGRGDDCLAPPDSLFGATRV